MKKKFFSVIVAIIAMLALSLNVFAANSIVGSIDMPQASSDKGSVTLGKVPSGKYSRDLQNVIDRLNNAARNSSVKNAFGDKLPSSVNLYDKNGVLKKNIDLGVYKFLSPVMDLTFDGVTPSADNPVRVTFVANNMTDNIQVDILYYCPEHGWEVLQGEKVSDNQVAAYFHAGSSVVALIYRDKTALTGTNFSVPAPVLLILSKNCVVLHCGILFTLVLATCTKTVLTLSLFVTASETTMVLFPPHA